MRGIKKHAGNLNAKFKTKIAINYFKVSATNKKL
jgi:hypothetical protein